LVAIEGGPSLAQVARKTHVKNQRLGLRFH
jgi:hypothetical protein